MIINTDVVLKQTYDTPYEYIIIYVYVQVKGEPCTSSTMHVI